MGHQQECKKGCSYWDGNGICDCGAAEAGDRYYINAERVHNWTQCYADLPYYADLRAVVRLAIKNAHFAHHRGDGPTAREAAEQLAARFPELELTSG